MVPHVAARRVPMDMSAVTDDVPGVDGLGNSHPVFRDTDDALHATNDPADNAASDAAQHSSDRTSHLASGRRAILNAADHSLGVSGCGQANGGHHEQGGCNRASHFRCPFSCGLSLSPEKKARKGPVVNSPLGGVGFSTAGQRG
jgi:hypothetical protein